MASKWHLLPFILFHLAFFTYSHSLVSKSNGFTLKITRRNFPHSENYDHFPDMIRPQITRSGFIFTIDASIGTPSVKRSFIFDTGSDLTWTQCTPCINCFNQNRPLFDPTKSKTYKKLYPNHTLSKYFKQSNNGDLTYHLLYGNGESSSGIASLETFSFTSQTSLNESIKAVVLGCSNNQKGKFKSSVSGIMGMSRSPLSLIGQMNLKLRHRFSYCLPPFDSPVKTTFLRFASDVKGNDLRKTSFLNNVDYNYRVPLLDISIEGRRLNIPKGTFRTGCMLDIGSGFSYLETRAYNEVVRVLMMHMNRFNLTRITTGLEGELCYRNNWGFHQYPNMTLHFGGAKFEIEPRFLFHVMKDRFCLAMLGRDDTTVLGAFQQQNVRIIYDVGYQKLLFGKEDCSKDRA